MYHLTDANFQDYLTNSLEQWNRRLADWQTKFSADPSDSLIEDTIFRVTAAKAVYERVFQMFSGSALGSNYKQDVERLRDYALSTVLTAAMNPRRSSLIARDSLDCYTVAAWARIYNDLIAKDGKL